MKHHPNRKWAAVALTAGLVMAGGGVASAYFTSTGTGHGSASVGTATDDFIFTTSGPAALYPGADPQPFDVTTTNNGPVPEHVGSVPVSLMTSGSGPGQVVTDDVGTAITGCLSSWFTVTPSVTLDQTVAAGDAYTLTGVGRPTIQFTESGTDQTACEGRSVGILFGTPG